MLSTGRRATPPSVGSGLPPVRLCALPLARGRLRALPGACSDGVGVGVTGGVFGVGGFGFGVGGGGGGVVVGVGDEPVGVGQVIRGWGWGRAGDTGLGLG